MKKVSEHTKRKWWYRWIRSGSYFSFRYWWFVWLLFLTAIALFVLVDCEGRADEDCYSQQTINERMRRIDDALDNCCNCDQEIEEEEIEDPPEEPKMDSIPPDAKPCNAKTRSGGDGITRTKHALGTTPGKVTLTYDMDNVPDKLDVYYEGKLIGSTRSVPGNRNGFVGGLTNGCCSSITFNYKPNKEQYCTVVVTGGNKTSWSYTLGCPR